jgi:predicted protein tyrosine phosphatase
MSLIIVSYNEIDLNMKLRRDIVIVSRDQFWRALESHKITDLNVEETKNRFFISINSTKPDELDYPAYFKKEHPNVLTLWFDDIESDINLENGDILKCMTEEQGKRIIAFLDQLRKLEKFFLLIHCTVGISRSGAVGLFASHYLGHNEEEKEKFNRTNKHIHPNGHVSQVLFKLAWNMNYKPEVRSEENLSEYF